MAIPAELLQPKMAFYFVGVLVQLSAAALLLYLAPGDNRHRSFAALITLNAVWDVVDALVFSADSSRFEYYLGVSQYLSIWSAAALLWFLTVYPRRRRHSGVVTWAILGVAVVATIWYGLDHSVGETAVFGLISLGWAPLLAFGAYVVLRSVHRRPKDPRRWSMILVGMALLVYPLSQSVTLVEPTYWRFLGRDLAETGSAAGVLYALNEIVYLLSRVASIVLAAWGIWLAQREKAQPVGKTVFVAGVLATIVLVRIGEAYGAPLPPINALAFGVLVAYALARAQLFDIDLKLKFTISRGTLLGVFAFVFIVVSQMAQFYVEQHWGQNYLLAGVACGLLLFAFSPLQRWADRLAHRVLPQVEPTPSYTRRRKRDLYMIALAEVWQDGTMTVKERRLLDRLAQQLDLPAKDLQELEAEVSRILPVTEAA